MCLHRLQVSSSTRLQITCVKTRKSGVTAVQRKQEQRQNGHTGARTLDRSVISTVLYRLNYTTGRRQTHPSHTKLHFSQQELQCHTHARSILRLYTTLYCSTACNSSLHLLSTRSPLIAIQTPCLDSVWSPSTTIYRSFVDTRSQQSTAQYPST